MNKKLLMLSVVGGFSYLMLTAYTGNPSLSGAGNRTGAAGSTADCSSGGCHAASSSATTIAITVTDLTGTTPLTKYKAGTTYKVTINGTSTTAQPKFGFQLAATNSSNLNGGTLSATAVGTAAHSFAGLTIIEHTLPLSAVPAGTYSVSCNWTAPAAGSGPISFYAILNAVNGTGTTSGDLPSNGVKTTLTEQTSSIAEVSGAGAITVGPNPCTSKLQIFGLDANKDFTAEVFSMFGQKILTQQNAAELSVEDLAAGTYFLNVSDAQQTRTLTFVKQ